jgi:hypothetical protein
MGVVDESHAMSFSRILVVDWETSGLLSEIDPPVYAVGPQGIELGAAVVDTSSWTMVGDFSCRVRFQPGMHWSEAAERIHGISRTEASSGPGPTAALDLFDTFLSEFFSREYPILLGGQNPWFDRWFTHQLFWLAGHQTGFPWKFHSRMLDTFSLGYLRWGCTTGDELYQRVCGIRRQRHSAHQDACLGATVICEAFQLNSSLSEDEHGVVPDRAIHPDAPPGDQDQAPLARGRDDCRG